MSDAALHIRDLKFRYTRRRHDPWILDIPSLELGGGEQMLITGGSGSGKSTLLHLVAGLMNPRKGTIEVDGQAVHRLHGARRDRFRGRSIGIIFQNFNLLHGFSALENVMAALMFSDIPRSDHGRRARSLLDRLGIDQHNRDPDRLSIGQQQRVAVARAIACRPALVLADEPTASLDPDNAAAAVELIQQTCRDNGAALLCVSHDPALQHVFERRHALGDLATLEAAAAVEKMVEREEVVAQEQAPEEEAMPDIVEAFGDPEPTAGDDMEQEEEITLAIEEEDDDIDLSAADDLPDEPDQQPDPDRSPRPWNDDENR